jgi:hypothetical protein
VASPAYWASTGWRRAATSLWAIVAGRLRSSRYFCRYFWTTAARYLRQTAEYLWPIIAFYLRKSSRHLWATAEKCRRQSTEYICTTVAAHLGKSSKIRLALVAALAVASGLVGFVTTTAFLRPPAIAPATHEAQPQAKLSWVTEYEIERAQKLGRQLLDISPAALLSMYERNGSDAVETYRDAWVKIDYPIMSFDRQTFAKTTYDVVEAAAHFQSVFPGKIIAIFSAQQWGKQLHIHRAGDQIVAFCKFREIEREEVLTNIHRLWFYGTGCDLPQLLEPKNAMIYR